MSPGNYVLLTVSDSGSGMTEEVQRRIFEPFFTTKPVGKGTGLGLAMVHGIVSRSGGSIQVISNVGEGTTFKIMLPQSTDKTGLDQHSTDAQRAVHGTETILLVEDDNSVRGLSSTVLAEYGFKVLEATDGNDAIQLFLKHRDQIQIIITDIVMPGMNGASLVEQLRQLDVDVPILFISGYIGEPATRDRLGDRKVNFLQKPFEPNQLVVKVREVLDQRSQKQ